LLILGIFRNAKRELSHEPTAPCPGNLTNLLCFLRLYKCLPPGAGCAIPNIFSRLLKVGDAFGACRFLQGETVFQSFLQLAYALLWPDA